MAPRMPAVIEREQVLHVAKLARLRLSDAEVERMAGELSGILEHVDRIGELELDDRPAPRRAAPEVARRGGAGAGAGPGRGALQGALAAGGGLDGGAARAERRRG